VAYRIGLHAPRRPCAVVRLPPTIFEENCMSIWRVLVPVMMLGVAACAEPPVDEPRETAVDQEIGLPPSCPTGQTVIFWEEPFGSCGGCTLNHMPAQQEHQFAGCSGNLQGTKRPIQNLCDSPCPLN
jgi:hypothetical protein